MEGHADDKKRKSITTGMERSQNTACEKADCMVWFHLGIQKACRDRCIFVCRYTRRGLEGCSATGLWKRVRHERWQTSSMFISVNHCIAHLVHSDREIIFDRGHMDGGWLWECALAPCAGGWRIHAALKRSGEQVIAGIQANHSPAKYPPVTLSYCRIKSKSLSGAHRSPSDLALPDFSGFISIQEHLRVLPPLAHWLLLVVLLYLDYLVHCFSVLSIPNPEELTTHSCAPSHLHIPSDWRLVKCNVAV